MSRARSFPADPVATFLKARFEPGGRLGLERMMPVLERLGRPQDRLPPTVHIAGTNGKGSIVALLSAMAAAAGRRYCAFTSPHLVFTRESLRLPDGLAGDEAIIGRLERVEAAQAGEAISGFEALTAAALLAFAETPSDLVLLEVGMGGSDDATNVIERPALSVISAIDLDHREFLGDSLSAIARKKAGIIKQGCPVVVGWQSEDVFDVLEARALEMASPMIAMGRDFDAYEVAGRLTVQMEDRLLDLPLPALAGAHQIANAGVATIAALQLQMPEEAIMRGLETARWPARMQRLNAGPLAEQARAANTDVWLDGGHNAHAARALAEALRSLEARDGRETVLVCGMLASKDAEGFFDAFKTLNPRIVATAFSADAASPPERLVSAARAVGLRAEAAPDVAAALEQALAVDGAARRVMICGSLYLAGEVLALSPDTWPT